MAQRVCGLAEPVLGSDGLNPGARSNVTVHARVIRGRPCHAWSADRPWAVRLLQ